MGKYLVYYFLFGYAIIVTFTVLYFDGTGDAGDSVTHYLFARYAPNHPVLYFDHWAKPVFVLLASPFAQFGFVGVKLFNALVTFFTIILTYKMAEALKLKNTVLVPVFMLFSPLYYILTFSGLTEPLFALFTAAGILLCLRHRYLVAALVVSFLPYVRSEGLIILGVFGLYFLVKQNWRVIPALIFGSVVYGIAGYFVYHDFLWVFTKIPYAKLSSVYGQGPLLHFVEQLINVTGVPLYALFWLGFISLLIKFIKRKVAAEQSILILLGFTTFFMAHTLFWYLGIFNSMGLKRVLLGIMPMIAIMMLHGLNMIVEEIFNYTSVVKRIVYALILIYVLVFPFTPNPSAIQWRKDMMLCEEQHLAEKVADFIGKQKNPVYPLMYSHYYLSVTMNLDHFDTSKKIDVSRGSVSNMKPGEILIWDNRFADSESGINKKELDEDPTLKNIFTCKGPEHDGEMIFAVYEKN